MQRASRARTSRAAACGVALAVGAAILAWSGHGAERPRTATAAPGPCEGWRERHPDWVFCDDFEGEGPLRAPDRYFEAGDAGGRFGVVDGVGVGGSRGIRARWRAGDVGAGGLKLAFGRNPNSYMRSALRADEDLREIWYRMDLRMQEGWVGNPAKLSRATIFTERDDWSQAMIAHLWGDRADHLLLDPVRCVDAQSRVKCRGYNDFDSMDWLGYQAGVTPIFGPERAGRWHAVEAHVRLNDPGRANGVHELWIDGRLEARREGLDFVRGYTAYGINAIFFENYWNDGSPVEQERYWDHIVVSTAPIGTLDAPAAEPTEPTVPTEPPGATATPTLVAPSATSTVAPLPSATATPRSSATPVPTATDGARSTATTSPAGPGATIHLPSLTRP